MSDNDLDSSIEAFFDLHEDKDIHLYSFNDVELGSVMYRLKDGDMWNVKGENVVATLRDGKVIKTNVKSRKYQC